MMKINNKDIKKAWIEIVNERIDKVPSKEEMEPNIVLPKKFSELIFQEYNKKTSSKGHHAISKTAVCLIIVVTLIMSAITAYAIYKIFIEKVNEKNTDVLINDNEHMKETLEYIYKIKKLPKGYKKMKQLVEDNFSVIRYSNGKYDVNLRQEAGAETHIDNEDTEQISVSVNGTEGIYIHKNDEALLMFYFEGYLFYIDTNDSGLSMGDLVKMAEMLITNAH